ncbi:MAG: type I secretion system permease/ATPase [Caulobacteraceae bacterium]|nr:type I secretion system permease/ATPase [Caulobacteraceae bacterium]
MFDKLFSNRTPLNAAMLAARPAVVTAIIFSMFINILALVSPMYMLQVYDRVLTSRNVTTLIVITLVAVFLLGIYAALEALRTQVLVRGGIRFDEKLKGPIFEGVLDFTLKKHPSGAQAFRDADSIREFVTGAGLIAFCDAPWVPIFVAVAFLLHPYFGILAIAAGILIFLMALANDAVTREPLKQATNAAIHAQNSASSAMRNAEVMKAMGMWGGLQQRWSARRDDLISLQAQASDRGGAVMSGIKFFRQLVQTLILGGGAYLAIEGVISPGAMIAASIIVGRALAPIEGAVGQWKGFLNARGAWERIQNLFDAVPPAEERMSLPPPKGRVTAEMAVIAPPGARLPTLKGANFDLPAGTTLGIVGPSAAGKSSLVRGLVGVWPILQGAVRLDGSELKHWEPVELGRAIGYLPQDVELFGGSVAENIARFQEFDPQEVIDAAQLAGCHEMIQELPEGYETQIGESGQALSGGQRQRLALARALFRMPALVVLDEPNASLDAPGEIALVQAIQRLKAAGRTVIFVTHKVNLLGVADVIMVLQGGVIAKLGPRDEVMRQLMGPNVAASPPAAQAKS